MFVRIPKKLSANFKELGENFTSMEKDIETIKQKQSEMKNTLKGINGRLDEAEDQVRVWKTR